MRAVRHTSDLYRVSRKRIGILKGLLPLSPVPRFSRELDRTSAFVTIEAMNCWSSFSRNLYLSTCRGAYAAGGKRLDTTMLFPDDLAAIRAACVRFRPSLASVPQLTHRDEPNWLDPNTLIIMLNMVGATNAGDVGAALSFQGRVLRDLPTFRNFYAHRAENTVLKAQRKMIPYGFNRIHPTQFCLSYEASTPSSILMSWLKELDLVQELAVS